MSYSYSPSTGGFYVSDIHLDAIPSDAIGITDDQYAEFFTALNSGKAITDTNGVLSVTDIVVTLAEAQAIQTSIIDAAYDAAISEDISFTTEADITATYQADTASRSVLSDTLTVCVATGSVGDSFTWKDKSNNTNAFTLTDLKNFAQAIFVRGQKYFALRTTLKAQITAATTVADVTAITWAQTQDTTTSSSSSTTEESDASSTTTESTDSTTSTTTGGSTTT